MPLRVRDAWVNWGLIAAVILLTGCMIQEKDTKGQLSAGGLIATPPSHYSTQKGRYLGQKYKENVNRLIELIIVNPKTSNLQFANNLASSGGMGFFTHSAVRGSDERYLEVVLGTGENLEEGEYSAKVARLFSRYGRELLVILASDLDIYNDRELSGYGLNFTWRTMGPRVRNERAIVYFPKEKVRAFLREDIGENTLLTEAVIFVAEPEGQTNLLSYRAPNPIPDVRAPIQEQALSRGLIEVKPEVNSGLAKGSLDSSKGIKPATNAGKSSASDEKSIKASESQTGSRARTPNETLMTKEEIVPDRKLGAVGDEEIESVGESYSAESASHLDNPLMLPRGATETSEAAANAVESAQQQVEQKPKESNLEVENTEAKTFAASTSIEGTKEKQKRDLNLEMADAKITAPMAESRQHEALGIHPLPAVGSSEAQSPSPKQVRPGGDEVNKLDELAANPKIGPDPAYTETVVPALTTATKLPNSEPASPDQQAVLADIRRIENVPEKKSLVRPIPRILEGYIIQVSFNDRFEARRWADTFEERGYAVSMTEAGTAESLRLRIGNFRLRDDAERQLKSIRENGLIGIVLNLPQPYRPEVRSSEP